MKCWLLLLAMAGSAMADAPALTLEAVLALADSPHPLLDLARARQAEASASEQLAASLDDFTLTLQGGLASGRNAYYENRFHPDNQASLTASKTLFDAGRQDSALAAAQEQHGARALQGLDVRTQRRLTLMARYFEVLLAEMQVAAATEFMASAYVAWDNAKDRLAVGQVAQWELAGLESHYLDRHASRDEALRQLRDARMRLGLAMNRTDAAQEDLVDPKLADNDRRLPEREALFAAMLAHNPRLLAQKRLLLAARHRIEGVRAEYRPSLGFQAGAGSWSREASTRNDLQAGLNFVWPLWQGGRVDAGMAQEQANFQEAQALAEQLQQELRQNLADTLQEIEYLRLSARGEGAAAVTYRDLALERARAEYEMELKTNLGTSMAETQAARLRRRGVEYRLALALARLEALLGEPLDAVKMEK